MCTIFLHLGGTVDVTVHQVIVDGKLRELHRASGGAWGGTKVDQAYEQFIADLMGLYIPVFIYLICYACLE